MNKPTWFTETKAFVNFVPFKILWLLIQKFSFKEKASLGSVVFNILINRWADIIHKQEVGVRKIL